MSKDITTRKTNKLSKAKEEYKKFLEQKTRKTNATEDSERYAQQKSVSAMVTLHCSTYPDKINIMEFEVSDEYALHVN